MISEIENIITNQQSIVFYDGDCGFCNFWIQWILERDHQNQFLFASLQSNFGQSFLKERQLNLENFDTIILWQPTQYYLTKSEAIIKIASKLGGIYTFLRIGTIFPKFLRNIIYSFISNRRKKVMKDFCIMPTEEMMKKFLN